MLLVHNGAVGARIANVDKKQYVMEHGFSLFWTFGYFSSERNGSNGCIYVEVCQRLEK